MGSLSVIFNRISSGLKVTHAKDDAAGLRIRDRLTKQILEAQADIKNITNEVSLLQVASGALSESHNTLQRMRELAVSASSEVLSFEDRQALELEFKSLMTHIDEIAENTTFNHKKILTQEAAHLKLSLLGDEQSGDDSLSTVLLPTLSTKSLGRQARYSSARRGVFLSPLETGDVVINGVEVRGTTRFDDALSYCYSGGSAIAKAKAINSVTEHTGVRAIIDETVVEAIEPIRELQLDEDNWLKVNGFKVSGFKIEAHDASEELRKQINAGISETGVTASVNSDGCLVLTAHDGRNVTVEYSDRAVREAIRIADGFGDPINLTDTVDAASYVYDGDIRVTKFENNTATNNLSLLSVSPALNPLIAGDRSGFYEGTRDLVDFVIEVVDPGPLGTATYRIKQEDTDHVAAGARDSRPEDYDFNADGVIQEHNSINLNDVGTVYDSASTRELKLVIVEEGNPYASQASDRPLVEITLYNKDSGIAERTVTKRLLANTTHSDFNADYGITFRVKEPVSTNRYQNASETKNVGQRLNLGLSQVGAGHDYSGAPFATSWTGTIKTDFTIAVTQDGHGIGASDPSGTPEPPAEITVTAELYRDGSLTPTSTIAKTFRLSDSTNGDASYNSGSKTYSINFGDPGAGVLTLSFPQPLTTLANEVTNPVWVQESGYDLTPDLDKLYYVGDEDRDYRVVFTSDGAFTSQVGDGPSADLYANGSKVGSIAEVNDSPIRLLGPGGVWEGLELEMKPPVLTAQSNSVAFSANSSIGYTVNDYNDENRTVILEITEGGDTSGSDVALYKYYYSDDPSTTIGTGSANFSGGLVLPDGLKISGTASQDNTVSQITASSDGSTDYLERTSSSSGNTSYTRGKSGDMTATLVGSTTHTPFTHKVLSSGKVTYESRGGPRARGYSRGGISPAPFQNIKVTGNYVSGGRYASTQELYVFCKDGNTFLTTGSDLDVDGRTALSSSGTSGSHDFVINSSTITISFNTSISFDDSINLSRSPPDSTVTAFKLEFTEENTTYDYDLAVDWTFEDGSTSSGTITDIQNKLDQNLNLDFGVNAKFDSSEVALTPLSNGKSFTLSATPHNLRKGDLFAATVESMVHTNDELQLTAKPQDLAVNTEWKITGIPPVWELNDEYKITYNHNFEEPELTLNSSVAYISNSGSDSMGTLELNTSADFETGDRLRVESRSYLGGVTSSGFYTESLYPTSYVLTVVDGGDISDASVSGIGGGDVVSIEWARADGRTDSFLDQGGTGSFTMTSADLDKEIDLEEGVKIKFNDLGLGAYLATGDQVIIPVGQKLQYSFSAGISLQSVDNINLAYSASTIDNLMGRMLFLGPDELTNTHAGEEFSLDKGLLGKSTQRSVSSTGLLTSRQIREAIDTIDVAIQQVSDSMTKIGALSRRAEHRIENLNQKALDLMVVRSRIQDADVAQEVAKMVSEQIKLMSASRLTEVSRSGALAAIDLVRLNAR